MIYMAAIFITAILFILSLCVPGFIQYYKDTRTCGSCDKPCNQDWCITKDKK